MEFQWTYDKRNNTTSEIFLKEQGVSKGLLAKVKFQGGKIKRMGPFKMPSILYKLAMSLK